MTRSAIASILGSICLTICAAAQAQNTPANSSTSTPPSTSSSANPTTSTSKPASGQKDASRAAKEQQSQKQKCPKNGDTSNVNCKEIGKSPQ
jgi:hypothetical protein